MTLLYDKAKAAPISTANDNVSSTQTKPSSMWNKLCNIKQSQKERELVAAKLKQVTQDVDILSIVMKLKILEKVNELSRRKKKSNEEVWDETFPLPKLAARPTNSITIAKDGTENKIVIQIDRKVGEEIPLNSDIDGDAHDPRLIAWQLQDKSD